MIIQEYTSENIDWTRVEFEDNQECLELIEKVKSDVSDLWRFCSGRLLVKVFFGAIVMIIT